MTGRYNRKDLLEAFRQAGAVHKGPGDDFSVDVQLLASDPHAAQLIADGVFHYAVTQVLTEASHGDRPVSIVADAGEAMLLGAVLVWAHVQGVANVGGAVVRDQPLASRDGPKPMAVVLVGVLCADAVRRLVEASKDYADVKAVAAVVDPQDQANDSLTDDYHVSCLLRRSDLELVAVEEKPEGERHEHAQGDEDTGDGEEGQVRVRIDAPEADDRGGDEPERPGPGDDRPAE